MLSRIIYSELGLAMTGLQNKAAGEQLDQEFMWGLSLYELYLCGDVKEVKSALCYISENYHHVFYDLVLNCSRSTSLSIKSYAAAIIQEKIKKNEAVFEGFRTDENDCQSWKNIKEDLDGLFLSEDDAKSVLRLCLRVYETEGFSGDVEVVEYFEYAKNLVALGEYSIASERYKQAIYLNGGEVLEGYLFDYLNCLFYLEAYEEIDVIVDQVIQKEACWSEFTFWGKGIEWSAYAGW